MATLSSSEILDVLQREFGETLLGSRDEGLDRMTQAVTKHTNLDQEAAEAAMASLVDDDLIRYEMREDADAGYVDPTDPVGTGADPMTGAQPPLGAPLPVGQESGPKGYWKLGT